jgi:hypothetical protein
MVEDTSREEIFGFRLTALTDHQVKRLQQQLPEVHLTVRKKETGSVVSFDVTATTRLQGLYEFLAEASLDPESYSVWISVVTSSDHSGVSLPPYVRDLIRNTSGGIDFSFTAALGGA